MHDGRVRRTLTAAARGGAWIVGRTGDADAAALSGGGGEVRALALAAADVGVGGVAHVLAVAAADDAARLVRRRRALLAARRFDRHSIDYVILQESVCARDEREREREKREGREKEERRKREGREREERGKREGRKCERRKTQRRERGGGGGEDEEPTTTKTALVKDLLRKGTRTRASTIGHGVCLSKTTAIGTERYRPSAQRHRHSRTAPCRGHGVRASPWRSPRSGS